MKLHTKILIGLVGGAALGIITNAIAGNTEWLRWLNDNVATAVGQIFLRMLLMTVVPLVFASLTLGVAGLGDLRKLGRVGGRTLAYFVTTTAAAVTLGLILVNTIAPGEGLSPELRNQLFETYRTQAEGMQAGGGTTFGINMFVNIVPRNPVQAAATMDMLGLIFFSIVLGAALTLVPKEKAEPVLRVLDGLGEAVVKIIDFAMKLAPYGVFALIFSVTSRFGWTILGQLSLYVTVVLLGILVHAGVTLSLFVKIGGGMSPLLFWKRVRASIITAFSTSSSAATLPTNLSVAERELGIDPRISGFVLPLGATMNMNGTSLFEGVTVLFLAQVFGVDLSLGQQIVVIILSVMTAIGAAGVPGGSLPLMMVVLATIGVPPAGIAIVLGVDRILDMCRTTLNVCGDLATAVCVARAETPDLAALPQESSAAEAPGLST